MEKTAEMPNQYLFEITMETIDGKNFCIKANPEQIRYFPDKKLIRISNFDGEYYSSKYKIKVIG